MSSIIGPDPETQQQQQKGPGSFLSNEERQALARMLGFPEDIPPEHKSWLIDYVRGNMSNLPLSTLQGFQPYKDAVEQQAQAIEDNQVTVRAAAVTATGLTTSGTYTDLSTGGPSVTAIVDGSYVIFYGFTGNSNTSNGLAQASLFVNSSSADANADRCEVAGTNSVSVTRAVVKTLSNGDNNTIEMKYKIGNAGTASFGNRWLIVMKIGPA